MKSFLKNILIPVFLVIFFYSPLIKLFNTSIIQAATSELKVTSSIDTYTPSFKKITIYSNVVTKKTVPIKLSVIYADTLEALKDKSHVMLVYSNNELVQGREDGFLFSIRDINSEIIWMQFFDEVSGELTPAVSFKLPKEFVTKKPVSVEKTLPYPPLISKDLKSKVSLFFSENPQDFRITDRYLGISGFVSADTAISPISISVYLGKNQNNLDTQETLVYIPIPQPGGLYSWFVQFPYLDPGTDYYFIFKNDLDKNTGNIIGNKVYHFKTLGETVSTKEKPSLGGNSPAATDNDGQGGIFSYQYPKNTGDPGSLNYDLSGGDGQLVPCSSDTFDTRCRYADLMVLVTRIIKFGLAIILPIIAIIAVYTGIQMIMNRSNPIELQKYKGNATRIAIGIAVILLAWTLVATILAAVLGADAKKFILLDLTGL